MVQPTSETITVLIVDDIPETRDNLSKLLYFESDIEIVDTASNGREAIEKAKALQPDIVLMDINMPDMDGISASQEISQATPASQVIMMSVQSEADYLRRSMLAGAMDFLTKPFTSDELSSSIHRVYEMGASRRASLPMAQVDVGNVPAGTALAGLRPSLGGKLLLVYSPKGGTGCSTIAVNEAIALAQVSSKKVALLDASLQFGDISVLLHLQAGASIADASSRIDELDSDLLSAMLQPHSSGIHVLTAPPVPEAAETIDGDQMKTILTQVLEDFDYVVVDTSSYLDDIVLAAMDLAARVLLVLTPEIPSIKSAKQFLEVAEALSFPLEQIDLILNKTLPRDGIRPDQLESHINHTLRAQISYDPRAVRQATNQGLPLVISEPNHALSQAFLDLARQEIEILEPEPIEVPEEQVAAPKEDRKKRAGLFGRLKR